MIYKILERLAKRWLAYTIIIFATSAMWAGLELVLYGEIQPREVDNLIGIVLWLSLMSNYDHWIEGRQREQ